MEWVLLGIIVLFFIWRMVPAKGISNITTTQLKSAINDKEKQFIDVRTPGEYKSNHIRQFTNIPLNTLGNKTEKLKKDKEVVVICQSGMRSSQACKLLKKQGFEKVTNVRGGMNAWH